MWLIHQFEPLFRLHICKEYPIMGRARTPRSTNGKGKPTNTELQLASEAKKNLVPINLDDEIRRRAYELSEQRGFTPGHENEDWFTAEREILSRYNQQTA